MRKNLNDALLLVLDEEKRKEYEREEIFQTVTDPEEIAALERKFGLERAQASRRIIDVSNEHEALLKKEMKRLGIV